jgi:hypothetical protein
VRRRRAARVPGGVEVSHEFKRLTNPAHRHADPRGCAAAAAHRVRRV